MVELVSWVNLIYFKTGRVGMLLKNVLWGLYEILTKPLCKIFITLVVLFLLLKFIAPTYIWAQILTGDECTIGVAMESASADGRPFSWKNRDDSSAYHYLQFHTGPSYKYLAMKAWDEV